MKLPGLIRPRKKESRGAIPKIIHQFWDADIPPADVAAAMQTWRDHHPGWRYILWNDGSVAAFLSETFGKEAAVTFLSGVLPAMRSDIARLAVLLVHGGVYVDAAFACVRPIDELTEAYGVLRVRPALPKLGAEKLSNGFIAAQPGSALLKHAWRRVQRNVRKDVWNLQVSAISGPGMLTDVWENKLSGEERERYTLISKSDFARFAAKAPALGHRSGESHWVREIKKRQIINPKLAEFRLRTLEKAAARQVRKAKAKAASDARKAARAAAKAAARASRRGDGQG